MALATAFLAGGCHLLTSQSGEPVGGGPLPDAGTISDGCHGPLPDGGYVPDAYLYPDGGSYYPDAGSYDPDGGSYYPDAAVIVLDAGGHGH